LKKRDKLWKSVSIGEAGNPRHLIVECGEMFCVNRRLVHTGHIVVAGLEQIALSAGRFENAAQNREVAFLNLLEAAPSLTIGRNGVCRDPTSACERIEVRARIDLPIERGKVHTRAGRSRLRCRQKCC
jgi:hypothetical protein